MRRLRPQGKEVGTPFRPRYVLGHFGLTVSTHSSGEDFLVRLTRLVMTLPNHADACFGTVCPHCFAGVSAPQTDGGTSLGDA